MPLPIGIVEQALGQYLGLFRDCFSQPQWQHFVTRLRRALMQCEEHPPEAGPEPEDRRCGAPASGGVTSRAKLHQ